MGTVPSGRCLPRRSPRRAWRSVSVKVPSWSSGGEVSGDGDGAVGALFAQAQPAAGLAVGVGEGAVLVEQVLQSVGDGGESVGAEGAGVVGEVGFGGFAGLEVH